MRSMVPFLVLCTLFVSALAGNLHHRMLILSKPSFGEVDFLTLAMNAYGIPYDLMTPASSDLSKPSFWTHADGAGKYSGIFITPDLETDGTLSTSDITTMWNYTIANSVRTVKINAWAWNHGYVLDSVGSADAVNGVFAPGALALAPVANLNASAKLPLSGLWRISGTTISNQCWIVPSDTNVAIPANTTCKSVTPVIQAPPVPGSPFQSTTTVGWTSTWSDGREVFVTVHPCAAWSTACVILSHYTLAWVTRGLLPGRRIATLNTQIDDLFLTTEDAITGVGFRVTNADFTTHINWLKTINAAMPAGSSYKPEFAFNGNGIIAKYDPNYEGLELQFDIDNEDCYSQPIYSQLGCNCYLMDYFANTCTSPYAFCQACQKNFPKPLGTGAPKLSKTSAEYSAGWNKTAFAAADALFAAIAANTGNFATSFFYNHHTFTHQNLDNVTFSDAVLQLQLNQLMAGPEYLNLTSRTTWSETTMVTPQISGLANGDALSGMFSRGIRAVMGDNSFSYNLNPNPYLLLYTTPATSNYAGFPIIPRYATEVYFNATNVSGNLKLYNNIYQGQLGMSTWAQVLEREIARVVPNAMLKLRHDAHMFHQANLNTVNSGAGTNKSLLMAWVETVVTAFKSYALWPIVSYKADDLLALYKQREARDACNFDFVITTNDANGNVMAITARPGAACTETAPFTTPAAATVTGATKESFAADPVAPAYQLGAGKTATLAGIKWGVVGASSSATAQPATTVPLAVTVSPTDGNHYGCPAAVNVPTASATQNFIIAVVGTPTAPVSAITKPLECYATIDGGFTKVNATASKVQDVLKYSATATTATSCTAGGCAGTVATDALPDLLLTFKSKTLVASKAGQVMNNKCAATNAAITVVCGDKSGTFYVKTFN